MTCHIALSRNDFAVAFADSQGTTLDQSEFHGAQKIFAGRDFLVGISGSAAIGHLLFAKLRMAVDAGTTAAGNLEAFIKSFLQTEIRPHCFGQIEFVTATSSPDGKWIQTFSPGTLVNFSERSNFSTIGSGATFVARTYVLENAAGILPGIACVATALVSAKKFIDAADESLTVDSTHILGICANGKAYILGDERINPQFVTAGLRSRWGEAALKFKEIVALASTIISETKQAYRTVQPISLGQLPVNFTLQLDAARSSVPANVATLTKHLQDYCTWYDGVV